MKKLSLFRDHGRNIKVQRLTTKMVAAFAVLIIIPVIIIGYVSVNTSSKSLIEKAKENLMNSTAQTEGYY